jgi:hypothetical protein
MNRQGERLSRRQRLEFPQIAPQLAPLSITRVAFCPATL